MGHRWTFEECYELAKTCKCSSEFKEKNSRAYKASLRHGWLKEFTWFISNYRTIKWTYETCYNEAKKYSSRKQFQDNSRGAYGKALEQGWLDDYEWFITIFKPKGYWDDYEKVKEEAKKYSTRTEFYKKNQFVYNIALSKGWMENLIPSKLDMAVKTRSVYSYEFKDYNVVYVGLTDDKKRRHLQHLGKHSSGKSISPVLKFAKKYGLNIPEPIYWYEKCTILDGQKYEDEIIKQYKEQGWILLNKSKTGIGHGSVGCSDRKWTKKECYNEAKKYNSRTEFSRNCQSAYAKALKKGWLNDYIWFSMLGNKKWVYDTCYNEALKYKTRWDFGKGNHSAYQVASQNKWLDDYYWFEKPKPKISPRKWTYEACEKVAKECSSRSEFVKKYKGAYEVSRKNGWLNEFIPEKNVNQFCKKINDSNQYSISFDDNSY